MTGQGYTRKRQQTRERLVAAGMVVLARSGPAGARVAEVAAEAGVATGTFYNHFPSMGELLDAVIGQLITGVEIGEATLAAIEHDAAVRVVIGTNQLLRLVDVDPVSAAAFVRLFATVPEFRSRIRAVVAGTIRDGMESGRFRPTDIEAVADACIGAAVQWIRSSLTGEGAAGNRDRLQIMLSLVGLDAAEAEAVVRRALEAPIASA